MSINRGKAIAVVIFFFGIGSHGQVASEFVVGRVTHDTAQQVTVSANDPRPLDQLLYALELEYGWVVDYEDPVYQQSETRFYRGHQIVAGHDFTIQLPLTLNPTGEDRSSSIKSVVAAYDASGNPGQFMVRQVTPQRTDVVGITNRSEQPFLDTPVTLATQPRSVDETLHAICSLVAAKRGVAIGRGGFVDNKLLHTQSAIGGTDVPARQLLGQALAALPAVYVWTLAYEPETREYSIAFTPAVKTRIAADGSKHFVAIPKT